MRVEESAEWLSAVCRQWLGCTCLHAADMYVFLARGVKMKKALIVANMLFAPVSVFGVQWYSENIRSNPNHTILSIVKDEHLTESEKIDKVNKEVRRISLSGKGDPKDFLDFQYKGEIPLGVAIATGNENLTARLIELGADVNKDYSYGAQIPLTETLRKGSENVLKCLVEHKVNVNPGAHYDSPLHIAIEEENENLAIYLIEHGADVNKKFEGYTPLYRALKCGKYNIAKHLLKYGADVNERVVDSDYNHPITPLFWAIDNGHADIVKYLVEHGAYVDINEPEFWGATSLEHAQWIAQNGTSGPLVYTESEREQYDKIAKILENEAERLRIAEERAAEAERQRIAEEKAAEAERLRIAEEETAEAERLRIAEEEAAEAERLRIAKERAAEAKRQRIAEEKAAETEVAEAASQVVARESYYSRFGQFFESMWSKFTDSRLGRTLRFVNSYFFSAN